MEDYDRSTDDFDAKLDEYLQQGTKNQGTNPTVAPEQTANPQINDEEFYVDDDIPNGQHQPNQSPPPATTVGNSQPDYERERREYELRLAEERGRSAALAEQFAMANARMQPQQPQPEYVDPVFNPELMNITPEEQDLYGDGTRQFAEKVARNVMKQMYDTHIVPLQQRIYEQNQQLSDFAKNSGQIAASAFMTSLRSDIPDLDAVTSSPEWSNYLDQNFAPMSGGGVTLRKLMATHVQTGNRQGIKEVITDFISRTRGTGHEQLSPGRSQTGTPPRSHSQSQPRKLSYQKYVNARQQYQMGLMDYETYARIEDRYADAMANDNIDYNR